MVCLGNKQNSFCHWDFIQVLYFGLFIDFEGYSISSKGFLPAVVDILVSELNLPIPVHFCSLIPKMSMFTLAISCVTTSNLPWFMDLTFQLPMQYCSLQHQTLLPSPVTLTAGCCFCFGSVSSFFLELLLHCSPIACWAPTNLESSSFSVLSFCLSYYYWGSQGKNTEVFHSLLQWTSLSGLSTMTRPSWVALHSMANGFIELDKAVVHVISLITFPWFWFSFCLLSDG